MKSLTLDDLLSLEAYDRIRPEFRRRAMAHQNRRRIAVGPHVTLAFEDRLTVQYQIQEMLRIERIYERDLVAEELAAYNPLVPDGAHLTATMMIEFPDPDERRRALVRLRGIEETVTLRVGERPAVRALADEDLPRTNAEKTSAVHYLRFPLDEEARRAFRPGPVTVAIEHPHYRHATELGEETRAFLAEDFAPDPPTG
jgi:hypothetical protein